MKKYFITIIVSLVIGFFLSYFVITEYTDKKGVTVYKEVQMLYFFKYNEFNSKEEMDKGTINLESYVYQNDDGKYKVYIAITKNENNIDKIKKYYSDYNLEVEKYFISNTDYIKSIENLDNILINTDDQTVIGEIIIQGLNNYEEVVLNVSKD